MKKIICIVLISLSFMACKTYPNEQSNKSIQKVKESKGNLIILEGQLEQQGISTYQYGTHILKVEDRIYALKFKDLNPNKHLEEWVEIKGTKIEGYPLDGGPDYILVKSMSTIIQSE